MKFVVFLILMVPHEGEPTYHQYDTGVLYFNTANECEKYSLTVVDNIKNLVENSINDEVSTVAYCEEVK